MNTFQMLLHIRLVIEPFIAHLTRERSLPRVGPYMFLQFIVRTVRLVAQMTEEFASSLQTLHLTNPVHLSHVRVQRTLVFVILLTGGALKRTDIRVRLNVPMQHGAVNALSVAQMAGEIFLACVGFYMGVQVCFQWETSLAVLANVFPFAAIHVDANFVFVEVGRGVEGFRAFLAMVRPQVGVDFFVVV